MKSVVASVLELRGVCHQFQTHEAAPAPVLRDIDLQLREGEIVGLLGRSGCGKSTLLRICGGLIEPSQGQVLYRGQPLQGPHEGIAIVFQTFALYPWLTVLKNVELGLDALALSSAEVARRARAAIELIGLDGFQSAFPRELSGGMRQRVGFARALVSDPVLLLMDEPFSALDVLTAETLRTDFLDLWSGRELSTRSVLLVTHNIEEAVLMCDRILVLGGHPGQLTTAIDVALPRPRERLESAFRAVVSQVYEMLTTRLAAALDASGQEAGAMHPLPQASVSRLIGLLEALEGAPYHGQAQLAALAATLAPQTKDLFALATALQLLQLADLKQGAIHLTAAGRVFVQSDLDERKRLFREHLESFVPFLAHMREVLQERADHRAPRERFELELQDHLNSTDSESTLLTAIGWGRYAELFSYDDASRSFSLL